MKRKSNQLLMKREFALMLFLTMGLLSTLMLGAAPTIQAQSGEWTTKQNMPSPRADATAAVCNGKLYVFGGYDQGSWDARSETYEYDPATNIWTAKANMPTARWGLIAVEFNGKIYVFGGEANGQPTNVNQVYDPQANSWIIKKNMPSGFNQGLMGVAYGNEIYLFYHSLTYTYDPATDTYTAKASMPTSRRWTTVAVVDNKIYVIGGWYDFGSGAYGDSNANEAYDLATNTWTTKTAMPVSKYGATRENPVINGKIYVTHGLAGSFYTDNYMYDPSTDSWQQEASATYPRDGVACGVINNKLYVVGGRADFVGPYGLNYCEEYSPPSETSTSTTPTPTSVDSVTPDFSSITSSPYPLTSYSGNPVLTGSMVTDRHANFVADPFLFKDGNVWYMFFEVESDQYGEEIGVATSSDAYHWTYQKVVLSDSQLSLSFPQVYKVGGNYYMVPDGCGANSERLYTTKNFPYDWTYVSTLVSGRTFADPSLFYYNGLWWMFVGDYSGNQNCWLYYSQSLTGGWIEHPRSPIVSNDPSRARPAGRTILYDNGEILRFVQKCDVNYGEKVRAYQVDTLTTTAFSEREIPESPLLSESGTGWNAYAMHTFGCWWDGKEWIVSTDGFSNSWSIGMYTTQPQTSSSPPQNSNYVLGNVNVESGEDWWGGQYDACKFLWTNPTGTYAGNITVYLSHVASAQNNKMVVGIYSTGTVPTEIAGSTEKTGLTVGWNTQQLTGTFTLTNGVWYWLYVHSPGGSNGRMTWSANAGQHSWGNKVYDGTLPSSLTFEGTEQTVCSIYASLTPINSAPTPTPTPAYSLTINTTPINGLSAIVSNSSFTEEIASGTTVNLQTGTYTVTVPSSLTLHYSGGEDEIWLFSAWSDGNIASSRQVTLDKGSALSATYILQP